VKTDFTKIYEEARTSYSAFLHRGEDEVVRRIEKRVAKFLNTTTDNMENLQLLRYHKGQEFKGHFDFFTNEFLLKNNHSQRKYTFLLYLNDVPSSYGGGTSFTNLKMTVQPKKGGALYFHNMKEDGTGNVNTMHSGDKILQDDFEKWAINIWIRNTTYYS